MIKNLIGVLMLIMFFGGLFVGGVINIGWKDTIEITWRTVVSSGWIVGAGYLISQNR